jgi:hypothetical protein
MFEVGERSEGSGPDAMPSLAELWRESVGLGALMLLANAPIAGRSTAELLDQLAAWDRQAAWLAGRQTKLIARIARQIRAECAQERQERESRGLPHLLTDQTIENEIEAEVATALRLAHTTAGRRVAAAEALRDRLPDTQSALSEGRITYWQAATITEETRHLTAEVAQAVEARVLPSAARDTVGGLRRRLRRACMVVTPTDTSTRARQAKAERTVTLRPGEDGMAILQAIGPAPTLQALFDALDITAGRAPADDPRRMCARRFDALIDASVRTLDNERCPGLPRVAANVYVTMDLATLLGLRNHPAELHGYGPLPAPLARAIAADNGWQRLIADPVTGAPLDLGRLRRRPSAPLAAWIRTRDRVCLFPGCYRAAGRCDLDHRDPVAEGGRTDKNKLVPACPKHHRVRHAGWTYTWHPDRIVWVSPHGSTYTRFLPEPDLTIPPDLEAMADFDIQQDRCSKNTCDAFPDAEPRPPRPRPVNHPDYDPEPPDFESPGFGSTEFEPPEFEPAEVNPPEFEPPEVEPPPSEPPELDPSG